MKSAKANGSRMPKPEKTQAVGSVQGPKIIPNRLRPPQKEGEFLMFFDIF
jgi:hypothetical protein